MGWRFWRTKEQQPARPLPGDTGLMWQPGIGPVSAAARDSSDEAAAGPPLLRGASPQHPDIPSAAGEELVDLLAFDDHVLDEAFARVAADDVVALVRPLAARDAPGVRTAVQTLTARLGSATADQQGLATIVGLAPLSCRLPLLSGVTGSVHDDPEARDLLLAYAELLASRAEPLRAALLPETSKAQLRFSAHFACGLPEHDPVLAELMASPPVELLLATCVLLAQTCLDGAPGPDALRAEIADAFSPAA